MPYLPRFRQGGASDDGDAMNVDQHFYQINQEPSVKEDQVRRAKEHAAFMGKVSVVHAHGYGNACTRDCQTFRPEPTPAP